MVSNLRATWAALEGDGVASHLKPVDGAALFGGAAANVAGQRAKQRRLVEERCHGEPYPLPRAPVKDRPGPGAPQYANQRWRRWKERQERVNGAIFSLNQLAAATANSGALLPGHFDSEQRPTAAQKSILARVDSAVSQVGRQPNDLTESLAFNELMKCRDLYSMEPQNLAAFDLSKLKVAKGSVRPRDAKLLLPPEAAGYLRHSDTKMLLNTEEMEEARKLESFPKPYWDPIKV